VQGLAEMSVEGPIISFATSPGKVALDGDGQHGLYTSVLLNYIPVLGLSIEEVFKKVLTDVYHQSKGEQRPYVTSSMIGDFYFSAAQNQQTPQTPALGYAQRHPLYLPTTTRESEIYHTALKFYIDRHEVTNAAFAVFLNQQGNQGEGGTPWLDLNDPQALIEFDASSYRAKTGYESHPVIEVSWYGARAYCAWQNKRLPTQNEWLAAAGNDHRVYPWGDQSPAKQNLFRANYAQEQTLDGYPQTASVGVFLSGNGPGQVADMAGNVWEWVDAADGERRLLLGGSWFTDDATAQIRWTPYDGPYFAAYQVLRSIPRQSEVQVARLADINVTSFVDATLDGNTPYSYRIFVETSLEGNIGVSSPTETGSFYALQTVESLPSISNAQIQGIGLAVDASD
jgi:hypothetical protein